MKAEVANQLKIALVQAAGLTEGSPLVVFEVSSSDKILHRWRSQKERRRRIRLGTSGNQPS